MRKLYFLFIYLDEKKMKDKKMDVVDKMTYMSLL